MRLVISWDGRVPRRFRSKLFLSPCRVSVHTDLSVLSADPQMCLKTSGGRGRIKSYYQLYALKVSITLLYCVIITDALTFMQHFNVVAGCSGDNSTFCIYFWVIIYCLTVQHVVYAYRFL